VTILLSLLFSLVFFAALCAEVGPLGKSGEVALFFKGCVKSVQEDIDEIEEAERLVKESQRKSALPSVAESADEEDGAEEKEGDL